MGLTRRLDVKVTLLQPVSRETDAGGRTTHWVPWTTEWMALEAQPAREQLAAGGEQTVAAYQGTLRYRVPPAGQDWTDLRVERGSDVFDIKAARPVGRAQALVLDLVAVRS